MSLKYFKKIGALTSKPYAFLSRPWELKNVESVDFFDAVGSNIVISHRNSKILRIQPSVNKLINNEWISDKIRFAFDGIKYQRLFYPLLKDKSTNELLVST